MTKRQTLFIILLFLSGTTAHARSFQNSFLLKTNYAIEAKIAAVGLLIAGWYTTKTGLTITKTHSHAWLQKSTPRYLAETFSNFCTRLAGLAITVGGGVLMADGTNIIFDNCTIINYKQLL